MSDEHIVERCNQESLKLRHTRSTTPAQTSLTPPINIPTTNHINPISPHAHHWPDHERRFLFLPSPLPSFASPGYRCVRGITRHVFRQLACFCQIAAQAGSGVGVYFPWFQLVAVFDVGYGERDYKQAGGADWVGGCGGIFCECVGFGCFGVGRETVESAVLTGMGCPGHITGID